MAYLLKYQMLFENNEGTEEEPNIVEYLQDCSVRATNADYDKQMAFAKAEAYNGEIIVEEIPDPEPEPAGDDVWAELDAAYQEGVNAAYDQ